MKLTAATVRDLTLPAGVTDRIYFDDTLPRFGVRVRSGGSRTWIVQYGIGGKERKLPLGPVSALELGKARSLAKDILARVRLGEDPLAIKHEAAARAAETLGAVLPRYLAHKRAELRPRSYVEVERHLLVHAKPLHSRALAILSSDRRGVALLISGIAASSGAAAAISVRSSLSACCAWLMGAGLLDGNPVIGTNKPATNGSRDRLLDDREIRLIWNSLDDDRYGAIVKLLACEGLRREEVGGLRWAEVDLKSELIRLPAARCKNNRAHDVPLSAPALAILKAQPRHNPDGSPRELVFGELSRSFSMWTSCKQLLDRKLGDKVAPWRLHDWRRVVSTAMHERLDIAPHIVEAVLGHHVRGVPAIYNKSVYLEQQRIALAKWADLLEQIVHGRKPATVVKMPKRK
jgi:integrase